VSQRVVVVLGLVVSSALCIAATTYLISVGARINTQTIPLSPGQTYVGVGGLFLGVVGLALFLGLALRRADAAPARCPARRRAARQPGSSRPGQGLAASSGSSRGATSAAPPRTRVASTGANSTTSSPASGTTSSP
jgi:hypothetical protein